MVHFKTPHLRRQKMIQQQPAMNERESGLRIKSCWNGCIFLPPTFPLEAGGTGQYQVEPLSLRIIPVYDHRLSDWLTWLERDPLDFILVGGWLAYAFDKIRNSCLDHKECGVWKAFHEWDDFVLEFMVRIICTGTNGSVLEENDRPSKSGERASVIWLCFWRYLFNTTVGFRVVVCFCCKYLQSVKKISGIAICGMESL